jgi:hypothetical protein
LPGKITAQGSAVAQQPTRRRRALDCDLGRRDDARHGGRATPGCAWRAAECSVTAGHHRPSGSGDAPRRRRRGLGSAPARERPRDGRRPGSGRFPRLSRRHRPGGPPRLSSRLPSRPLALFCAASGLRPGTWRAGGAPLKPFVEKVVTGATLSLLSSVG